jgi:hypothetical protein
MLMVWSDCVSVELRPVIWPILILRMINEWIWSLVGKITDKRDPKCWDKNPCLGAAECTTDSTWTGLVKNPDLRSKKHITNHLSYSKALVIRVCILYIIKHGKCVFLYPFYNEPFSL